MLTPAGVAITGRYGHAARRTRSDAEPAVRDALGYATAPGEVGGTVVVQLFERGLLLGTGTPEGRFIYAIAYSYGRTGQVSGATYARYPDPAP